MYIYNTSVPSATLSTAKISTHETAPAPWFDKFAVDATTSKNIYYRPSFQSNAPPNPFDAEKYTENPVCFFSHCTIGGVKLTISVSAPLSPLCSIKFRSKPDFVPHFFFTHRNIGEMYPDSTSLQKPVSPVTSSISQNEQTLKDKADTIRDLAELLSYSRKDPLPE